MGWIGSIYNLNTMIAKMSVIFGLLLLVPKTLHSEQIISYNSTPARSSGVSYLYRMITALNNTLNNTLICQNDVHFYIYLEPIFSKSGARGYQRLSIHSDAM